ncbi:DUF2490 domain-containing protein [Flammeovirga agarivorans]|uniref:DUF2490 domain-containing protein n=1 Tax=Flammeovirga agarivorans TaxID=2726742 RepID=A0A7X8SPJ0_9BACT|nr:DUF2490 domain-containing protein [Flammeovirga agarivorans]NLR93968.1 DUF2490 domain-containing protein [Flammeovirga agarivorans]
MNIKIHYQTLIGYLVFLLTLISASDLFGQDFLWLHYFNKYKLSYKFSIDSDFGWRQYGNPEEYRGQFRTGLHYDLSDVSYVRGGIMYVNGTVAAEEIRYYQDFVYKFRIGDVTVQQRVRFEEQTFTDPERDFRFRLRYNPAVKFPSPIGQFTLSAEPFFTLTDPNSRVSSNRLLVGLTNKVYKNISLSIQYINERSYTKAETNFIDEAQMIRIKIDHVIHPLKTGPLFGRNKM